jgi:hypothetical protein
MSTRQLEKRVARLESELAQLKADFRCATSHLGWRGVIGTHEGSPMFECVLREMRRLRREDYKLAAAKKADSRD